MWVGMCGEVRGQLCKVSPFPSAFTRVLGIELSHQAWAAGAFTPWAISLAQEWTHPQGQMKNTGASCAHGGSCLTKGCKNARRPTFPSSCHSWLSLAWNLWLACYLLLIPVFASVTFAPHICVSHFTDCAISALSAEKAEKPSSPKVPAAGLEGNGLPQALLLFTPRSRCDRPRELGKSPLSHSTVIHQISWVLTVCQVPEIRKWSNIEVITLSQRSWHFRIPRSKLFCTQSLKRCL